MIDESPVYSFILEYLSMDLVKKNVFNEKAPICALTELEQYSNSIELAKKIINDFATLPWEYSIAFKLNLDFDFTNIFLRKIKNFELDDKTSLVCKDKNTDKVFPLSQETNLRNYWKPNSNNYLSLLQPFTFPVKWEDNSIYFRMKYFGFYWKI